MKHVKLICFFCLLPFFCVCQLIIDNNNLSIDQYIQNILIGDGVSISNVTFNAGPASILSEQLGSFEDNNSLVTGISNGFIMGTGDVQLAAQPNISEGESLGGTGLPGSDADLQSLTSNTIYDECVIEFDFIPEGDSISFNYVFGSEEYPEYVCATYNDAFGFFLTGPNPYGADYNAKNIALIPNPNNLETFTNTPVAINTVNPGVSGLFGFSTTCSAIDPNWSSYSIFYNDNNNSAMEYDGSTTVLKATAAVYCGVSYHIKLAIGDGGDSNYDSGVFLEGSSFSSNVVEIESGIAQGDTLLYEGCNSAFFNFERVDASNDFTIYFELGGTATMGEDYPIISDSIIVPAGQFRDTIFIYPTLDSIAESTESIELSIIFERCYGQFDTSKATIYISDYSPLNLSLIDSLNICNDFGETALIKADWNGGINPFNFEWSNGQSIDSIIVSPEFNTFYTLNIIDGCNKEVNDSTLVWNQCPIEIINVFTPNNDKVNDFFIPINLEQYPSPSIYIYNRWGGLVYENSNYNYDWDGKHYKSGESLNDDVYFYLINPKSSKYKYSNSNNSELSNTISGYVHIIKD